MSWLTDSSSPAANASTCFIGSPPICYGSVPFAVCVSYTTVSPPCMATSCRVSNGLCRPERSIRQIHSRQFFIGGTVVVCVGAVFRKHEVQVQRIRRLPVVVRWRRSGQRANTVQRRKLNDLHPGAHMHASIYINSSTHEVYVCVVADFGGEMRTFRWP